METKNKRQPKSKTGYRQQLKDGVFTGKYFFNVTINGQRFRETIKAQKSTVKSIFNRWYQEKEIIANSGPENYKLFDKLDEFLQFLKEENKVSRDTFKKQRIVADLLKVFFSDSTLLKNIIRADIKDFIIFRRSFVKVRSKSGKHTVSESTINTNLACISVFFNYCIDRNYYLKNNPASRLKSPYKKREVELTAEQRQELLDKADERMKIIILLTIYAGLRRKETCGLQWDHIDFENNEINLPGSITKGGKEASITVPDQLIDALYHWKCLHPDTKYVVNFKHNGTVTQSKRKDYLNRYWCNYRGNLSFTLPNIEKLHLHDLRHEFANDMLINGVPLHILQKQMRHTNISTTEKYLTNKKKVKREEIQDKLSPLNISLGDKDRQKIGKEKNKKINLAKMPQYNLSNFRNIGQLQEFVKQLKTIV